MEQCFLAVDIGASSGRHILGSIKEGSLFFEEIYRFENGMKNKNGHLCWSTKSLFLNIIEGMKKCREIGKIPASIGIDTWGCDFVLLDENDQVVGDTVAYRDKRTTGMDDVLSRSISPEELYSRTGIQKQIFNTVYQLTAIKEKNPEMLEKARTFLMIPDYFNFLLCGKKANEYTNATTTGMVNAASKQWDRELFEKAGFPADIFLPLSTPGTVLGDLLPEIAEQVGFSCKVVLPCTHDTGSAVAALPCTDTAADGKMPLYISSGTWSLLGTEQMEPRTGEQMRALNFTNEGGYDYRFRILKNIMGLWMIQSLRKELAASHGKISFDELDGSAEKQDIPSIVDCNEQCFLAPDSMTDMVKLRCAQTGQRVPETPGELAAVVYNSLAVCYANAVKELESIFGCTYTDLYIIGGGSRSVLLNTLTAKKTGLNVHTGPSEATAIGNCLVQMISAGVFADLQEARASVKNYVALGGN